MSASPPRPQPTSISLEPHSLRLKAVRWSAASGEPRAVTASIDGRFNNVAIDLEITVAVHPDAMQAAGSVDPIADGRDASSRDLSPELAGTCGRLHTDL